MVQVVQVVLPMTDLTEMAEALELARAESDGLLRLVAIGRMESWFAIYDRYVGRADGRLRRGAMVARARGVIEHDRIVTRLPRLAVKRSAEVAHG